MSSANKIFMTTYVEYTDGCLFSKLMAVASLFPVFAYAGVLSATVSLRCLRGVSLLLGLIFSHLLNAVLKDWLEHARPEPLPGVLHPLTTHGMPSNHAQQAAFLSAYVICNLVGTHPLRSCMQRTSFRVAERYLALIGSLVYCLVISYSRVYMGAHSMDQVLVGAAIGCGTGVCWAYSESSIFGSSRTRALVQTQIATSLGIQCAECFTGNTRTSTSDEMNGTAPHKVHLT